MHQGLGDGKKCVSCSKKRKKLRGFFLSFLYVLFSVAETRTQKNILFVQLQSIFGLETCVSVMQISVSISNFISSTYLSSCLCCKGRFPAFGLQTNKTTWRPWRERSFGPAFHASRMHDQCLVIPGDTPKLAHFR